MADWIISHFPEHEVYLEPYFGSGAIFFNKKPSKLETINDLDKSVVNLFKVIRDHPEELARLIEFTPLSRQDYNESYNMTGESLEDARRFLVRCCQAIGAKTSDRTGWRSNINPKNHHKAKQWSKLPEKILLVTERLKEVQIENQTAEKLIERYRRKEVLIYADPTYLRDTRTNRHYKHEMTVDDHIELLNLLKLHPGPVILSGYRHQLYDDTLNNWKRETKMVLAESGSIKEEVLWINPIAAEYGYQQQSLF
jgi:DNA adenine methylase